MKSFPELNESFWTKRYEDGATGWDLGQVSPPLKAYIDGLQDKSISILIPGGGNAYEWEYLHELGFDNAYVIDISSAPIDRLKSKYPSKSEQFIHGDFFELDSQFDLIIEQTFFCALNPNRRSDYVSAMANRLNQNGRLVGLLFNTVFDKEGPPFGGQEQEYRDLLDQHLTILTLEPCYNSIKPRQGSELFLIAGPKGAN